jgi:predicted nucleotidyltransferase
VFSGIGHQNARLEKKMIAPEICGLTLVAQKKLCSIFKQFPSINRVILYGSRAMGNFKPGSDIDLTIDGDDFSTDELLSVMSKIDDLMLPYKVDLSIFHSLDHEDLLDHIKRVGLIFYPVST